MADSDVPTQDTGGSAEATLVPPAPLTLEAPPSGGTVAVGIPGRTGFERTRTIVVYTLLFAIALLYFVPFLWMLSTSFKTLPETAHFDLLPSIRPCRRIETRSARSTSPATRRTASGWR